MRGRKVIPVSILAPGMVVREDVVSYVDVQIDGDFEGVIHGKALAVGRAGRVYGRVKAENVCVLGAFYGEIRAVKIEIMKSADVDGAVLHRDLVVEDGATFRCRTEHRLCTHLR